MDDGGAGVIVVSGTDEPIDRQITLLADELHLITSEKAAPSVTPTAVVIDLADSDAVQEIRDWRTRCPDVIIAAFLASPARDTWEAAERAGADLVVNRGALVRAFRRLLLDLGGGAARRRRFPLFDAAEVAGRLGLIRAVDETPVGPVAVYRIDAGLVALADKCPHAGAAVSQGALEGGVVTCPAHGSRFDVTTGTRVRGPADQGLRVYTVVEEEGRVWLLWS